MIGEYKCSNYVAKSILAEVAPAHIFEIDGYDAEPKGNNSTVCTVHYCMDRTSSSWNKHVINYLTGRKKTRSLENSIQDPMLFDAGSRGYRDWLTK